MSSLIHVRGKDIFDPDVDYAQVPVHVIGAGGIGSFVVPALAKLGLKDITLWDADIVDPVNLDNQFFLRRAVGAQKVEAVKMLTFGLSGLEIKTRNEYWEPGKPLVGIVISALDSMGVTKEDPKNGRRELWDALKTSATVKLLIDGRLGGEFIRVLAIRPLNDYGKYGWYEQNLFPDKEAAALPCTAKNIIDVGYSISALITNLVRKFLKSGVVIHDLCMSMEDLSVFKPEV